MNQEAVPSSPRWRAVVLVCKACGKRSKAPKEAKPKAIAADVRRLTKGLPQRSRIVLTGCLGLCPKGATAVAVAGHAVGSRVVAIRRRSQVAVVESMMTSTAMSVATSDVVPKNAPVGPPATGATAASSRAAVVETT